MKRIKAVIERTSLMLSNQMEVNATRQVSAELIKNFLFGNGEQLVSGLAHHLQRYKTLAEWSVEKWKQVFKKLVFFFFFAYPECLRDLKLN